MKLQTTQPHLKLNRKLELVWVEVKYTIYGVTNAFIQLLVSFLFNSDVISVFFSPLWATCLGARVGPKSFGTYNHRIINFVLLLRPDFKPFYFTVLVGWLDSWEM